MPGPLGAPSGEDVTQLLQHDGCVCVDATCLQGFATVTDQSCDLCFVGSEAVAFNNLLCFLDLLSRGLGDPEHISERAALGGGGRFPGEGQ